MHVKVFVILGVSITRITKAFTIVQFCNKEYYNNSGYVKIVRYPQVTYTEIFTGHIE